MRLALLEALGRVLVRRGRVRAITKRIVVEGRPQEQAYMLRHYLLDLGLVRIDLHRLDGSDPDGLHDHPRSFVSLVLAGAYVEELADGTQRHRRAGSIALRQAEVLHRVIVPAARRGVTWTLVVWLGRPRRRWGFVERELAWEDSRNFSPHGTAQRRVTAAWVTDRGEVLCMPCFLDRGVSWRYSCATAVLAQHVRPLDRCASCSALIQGERVLEQRRAAMGVR